MIEVIYKEEKTGEETENGFYLPRNIKQIGLIQENYRIYMEDYVYAFLSKVAGLSMKMERKGRAAVLMGEVSWKAGITYVFVHGAVSIENTEVAAEHILLEGEVWEQIERDCVKYFPRQEIVGWFLTQQAMQIEATEIITRAHVKYFGGEKVLFLMEPSEKEDAFFRFDNNFLVKQPGYYLYYEKNTEMQNYMLFQKDLTEFHKIEQNGDKAVKNFRKIIQEKNDRKEKEDNGSLISFAATACLILCTGTVGFRFYQNYQEMQNMNQIQETSDVVTYDVKSVISEKTLQTPTAKPDRKVESPKKKETSITDLPEKNIVLTVTPVPSMELRKKEKTSSTKTKEEQKEAMDQSEPANAKTTFSYIVKPGDSLFQISLEYYGTIEKVPDICELNGFSEEEVIYPGQIIVLP